MRRIVVDANVTLKFLVEEAGSEPAAQLFAADLTLLAPDLALLEIANVLSRKVRLNEIGRAQADTAMAAAPQLYARLPSARLLADHAYRVSIDHGHPVYDTAYLALAEHEDALLVTDDLKFIARFAATAYAARFIALTDAPAALALPPPV